jgi:hypothetical protein
MKKTNPVVKEVLEKFDSIYKITKVFVSDNGSAMNGLLISGDAGTGKTYWVKDRGLEDVDPDNVVYIKGSSITAPTIFVKLFLARRPGSILVLDDVDIIHKTTSERNTILDLFKGATEMTKGERLLSWERAGANALMNELGVPRTFDFQGSVIWITNDTIEQIAHRTKGHWNAISSRFNQQRIYLSEQEKLLYTLYLIQEQDMLGVNCMAKEGGYSKEIVEATSDFIYDNYRDISDITPRTAIKIADLMESYPEDWKMLCENQLMS